MTTAMITTMTTIAILTTRRSQSSKAGPPYSPAITLHVAIAPSTLVQYPYFT